MRDAPEKFFLAHRLLSTIGLGGFGIRFTVQFNLFAGSIIGLGGEKQVAQLDAMQKEGALGCFLLTESQAGVLSGLIVRLSSCSHLLLSPKMAGRCTNDPIIVPPPPLPHTP
jgi:acyl-CoA oxidase